MSQDPELALAQHALAQGWLPRERLREALLAREQLRAAGRPADLALVLASGYVRPDQARELVARRDPSLPREPVPPAALARAAELARRPADEDPPAARQFLAALAGFGNAATLSQAPRAAAPAVQLPQAMPRRFGPFEVTGELGRGGMGAVYSAHHPGLDRAVAVKVVLGWEASRLKRFQVEARATARLRHPNIVGVHEVGVEQGHPYLVMDLIEGESLSAKLERDGPLPLEDAARLAATVARALDYAHRRGVVHRDLKPSNILLDREGTPVVTDFGLAKELADGESLTKTGQLVGTPAYMPPEQATGNKEKIGPLSDVYAVGATLYELLAGQPPFVGSMPMEVIVGVVHRPPTPPSEVRPRERGPVDAALEALVLRCLEKEPARRPASAAELAASLEGWLAARGGAKAGPAPGAGAGSSLLLVSIAVAAVVAAGVLGGLLFATRPPGPPAASAGTEAAPAPPAARAEAAAARGFAAQAQAARWEALRADPDDGAALAATVRALLLADDALGLARGWSLLHDRLGAPGEPTLEQTAREDERALRDALRAEATPARLRLRAALAAARHRRPELAAALRALADDARPSLLREAARASLLATGRLAPDRTGALEASGLDFARWAELAGSAAQDEGAAQALTLLERAHRLGPDDRAAVVRLGREAKGALLRAAAPLALALAATRAGGPPLEAVRPALATLAEDPDALVAGRAKSALGALAALEGDPAPAGVAAWRLSRALLGQPGLARALRGGAAWRGALAKAVERDAPQAASAGTVAGVALADALERGDAAAADALVRAAGATPRDPLVVELALQLRALGAPDAPLALPDDFAGGDPEARRAAEVRVELARRHGLPALPAGGEAVRLVLVATAPWARRALDEGFERRVLEPLGGAHPLDARGVIELRSRFGLQAWTLLEVAGRAQQGEKLWATLDASDALEAEAGLRTEWVPGAGIAHPILDGASLGVRQGPGRPPANDFSLAVERAAVVVREEDEVLLDVGRPARRGRSQGRAAIEWTWSGGRVDRLVLEGRPGESFAAPPSAAEVQARLDALVPIAGATRTIERRMGEGNAMADVAALRRMGQLMETRGRWLGLEDRACLVGVPALRGDVEVRARVRVSALGGQAAGVALRGRTPQGDAVSLGLGDVPRRATLVAQRDFLWPRTLWLLDLPRDDQATLALARIGDLLVARCGVGDGPLREVGEGPLPWAFAGPVDAVLYATSYDEGFPPTTASFDRIEVRVPRE